MDSEAIIGIVIILVCCWGAGALFVGIGIWACNRKTPMHFYAGTQIDPKSISDIPAYNRENGRMWMKYSIPYWISGVFGIFGAWKMWIAALSAVVILLACIVGTIWLVYTYTQIERKYIVHR